MAVASAVEPRSQTLIAELRHETRLSFSDSEAESVSDSESEALNPRNRLPESHGTGLYVL